MMSPRRLGKYELLECVGRGGMAEVWKGRDPHLMRNVAIKFLHANLRSDPDFVSRFQREGQAIARLRHPNIVHVYEFQVSLPDDDEPMAYMVMDFIEGPTLAEYVRSTSHIRRFPTPDEIVGLFTSINLAVDYAHRHHMVHRDIKPANILLDTQNTLHNQMGEPTLTDFGIVKMLGAVSITGTGVPMGTPLYISPEQAQGQPGNERSDIYSLGVMLYEICTGEPVYRGDTPLAIMTQHVMGTPVPPSQHNSSLTADLDAVILCALAKEPQARFANASALTIALAGALHVPVPEAARRSISSFDLDARRITSGGSHPDLEEELHDNRADQRPLSERQTLVSGVSLPNTFATLEDEPGRDRQVMGTKQGNSLLQPMLTLSAVPVTPPTSLMPAEITATLPVSASRAALTSNLPLMRSRRYNRLLTLSSVLLLMMLIASLVGMYALAHGSNGIDVASSSSALDGTVAFLSSYQLNAGGVPSINDRVQVQLQRVPDPAPGNQYYAWLQDGQVETASIYLGVLAVKRGGSATRTYTDSLHRDLVAQMSSFLVTEQTARVTPNNPSLDTAQWRYHATFPQRHSAVDKFSYLDHIRHLLSNELALEHLQLMNGVDYWLLNNTQEIYKSAIEARDSVSIIKVRQLVTDVLYYLDGKCALQELADTPGSRVPENDTIAHATSVSLLDCAQVVDPPGYITHVALHLNGIAKAPGVSDQQIKIAAQANSNLDQLRAWLDLMRIDALQLVQMDDAHLAEARPLRNDLVVQANYVTGGRVDPSTQVQQLSVGQVCDTISLLANMEVSAYK